ncbi:MAG TPA: TIGR04290 family methyltransferase [Polyangia bacterium]|jgi:tRNA (mo5U34)-methyltransferase
MSASQRLSRPEIERRVHELGEWFHNLDLDGVRTAPDHFLGDYPSRKWREFAHAIPQDLTGQTVLDIGCNAGFYAIEMKRRGAARVVGTDTDEGYLAQARFAAEVLGVDLELRRMSVYDVGSLHERFDVVLFMGVLYHLRHPLLALDLIHEHVARGLFVFQSMLRGSPVIEQLRPDYPFNEREIFRRPDFPAMYFVEGCYASDPTNWWIPNAACATGMLRSAGFEILDRPEEEVFICRRRELTAEALAHRDGEPRIAR